MDGIPRKKKYTPSPSRYVRSGVMNLLFLGCYHGATWLFYTLLLTPLENQMLGDEHEPQYRFVMFGFSLITLLVLCAVTFAFYYKNGERKRAFLAATSLEERGDDAPRGHRQYRRVALNETMITVGLTALVWLPSVIFYATALSTSGMGYGYSEAWFIEEFFVAAVGLYQPFRNPWVGGFLGLLVVGGIRYAGCLYAHAAWHKSRIRR